MAQGWFGYVWANLDQESCMSTFNIRITLSSTEWITPSCSTS